MASLDLASSAFFKQTNAKKKKGYTEIKMAAKKDDASAKNTAAEEEKIEESTLPPTVQTLVQFFFDQKLMTKSMESSNVDLQKMPLGQLSKETVLEGYKILRDLESAIESKNTSALQDLSGKFYTTIPHNFGR